MSERRRLLGLDDRSLEAECEVDRYRASGPGGQKRNKTESAVRVRHLRLGISAFADDSRSQHENRQRALGRLREKLALYAREAVRMSDGVYTVPAALAKLVERAGRATRQERASAGHLEGLAELLDLLAACEGVVADLAVVLEVTTAAASKLLTTEERVLRAANELRASRGLNALKV